MGLLKKVKKSVSRAKKVVSKLKDPKRAVAAVTTGGASILVEEALNFISPKAPTPPDPNIVNSAQVEEDARNLAAEQTRKRRQRNSAATGLGPSGSLVPTANLGRARLLGQ